MQRKDKRHLAEYRHAHVICSEREYTEMDIIASRNTPEQTAHLFPLSFHISSFLGIVGAAAIPHQEVH